MSEPKVENVKKFFDKLTEIQEHKEDDTELFFRGHADQSYEAEPAIFRKNKDEERNLLKNEKYLFNDIITQCPEDFKDCQNTFEYLVKMQHYGLPTRLLDITSNALVALYFACCSLKGEYDRKDGQVLVYKVWKNAIKNYNSDTVSVLSNLAQLDNDFKVLTKKDKEDLDQEEKPLEQLEIAITMFNCAKKMLPSNRKEFLFKESTPFIQEKFKRRSVWYDYFSWQGVSSAIEENTQNEKFIEERIEIIQPALNKLKYFQDLRNKKGRYIYFIKQEKNYFVDKIDDDCDVQKIVCVRAKLNNQRIIRQSGLFFLFGMGNEKGKPITFLEYVKSDPSITEITNPTIIISGQAKQTIIEELRTLGISKETLMPEIDTVARTIKNRYN